MKPALAPRLRAALRALRGRSARSAYGWSGSLTAGGYRNPQTGAGMPGVDRLESSGFAPTLLWARRQLEIVYVQSWAAKKYIDIPVEDMLIKWREWTGAGGEPMAGAERRHKVRERLSQAMRAGRLYGTGLLLLMTREDSPAAELRPERVREGDLSHLLVFDRYSASVWERDENPLSPSYGEPRSYLVSPQRGGSFPIHASRVLRFDGVSPLSSDGYEVYDRDWGVSEIVPAVTAILQDAAAASGISQLASEASVDVLRLMGYREALAGGAAADPENPSPERIGEDISRSKSLYRALFLDQGDEYERKSITWAGIPEIMDRFAVRLAATADIPATRFMGQSPAGMNATGESDMLNYATHVAAMQERLLRQPLARLDAVLARDAGLGREPPAYVWPPLATLSDLERAETLKAKAEAMAALLAAAVLDEDEARRAMGYDPLFPAGLPGAAPDEAPAAALAAARRPAPSGAGGGPPRSG